MRKVQEGTQSFTQDLLGEIERLHVLVASLEVEKQTLDERDARDPAGALGQRGAAGAGRLARGRDEPPARAGGDAARGERALRERAGPALGPARPHAGGEPAATPRATPRSRQQNSNLANLYVASYRLHGTLDRKEVIDTLQEIIANLIGSEEAGLFELDAGKQTLELVASFGLAADALPLGPARQRPRSARPRGAARSSWPSRAASEADGGLTACIPLKLDGKVTGAIAIFRLLPQKSGFEEVDRELFELLATHAATALYCTALHARLRAQEVAR